MAKFALGQKPCASLFNTKYTSGMRYDPADVLDGMMNGYKIGDMNFGAVSAGNLDASYLAITQVNQQNGITADIILQGTGRLAWYSQSAKTNAATLIHELGHVFNMVAQLGGSMIKYDYDKDPDVMKKLQADNANAMRECQQVIAGYK